MDNNSLLMIVLAFILGCMCSQMMKSMCGGRLVEGNYPTELDFVDADESEDDEELKNIDFYCDKGKYRDNNRCIDCPAGTYSENSESTSCSDCPAGTYSQVGSSSCEICPAGKFFTRGSASCYDVTNNTCQGLMQKIKCSDMDILTCKNGVYYKRAWPEDSYQCIWNDDTNECVKHAKCEPPSRK